MTNEESSFAAFIKHKTQPKTEIESITIRLPTSIVRSIDEFSSTLDITRQELLTKLIEESLSSGLKIYHAQLNKPDSDDLINDDGAKKGRPRYFILNTNKSNNSENHEEMVSTGIAAAYCDPWKFKIEDNLNEGDIVFLYESGVGIVGVGNANGITQKSNRGYDNDDSDDTYSQKLNNYIKVKSLSAKEIKGETGKNYRFLQTMFNINEEDGKKIKDKLIEIND